MVVAWCILLPISVVIARTCKHNWPPAWFQIHRAVGVRSFLPCASHFPRFSDLQSLKGKVHSRMTSSQKKPHFLPNWTLTDACKMWKMSCIKFLASDLVISV